MGCTWDTSIRMIIYIHGMIPVNSRLALAHAEAYMDITDNDRQPLFVNLRLAVCNNKTECMVVSKKSQIPKCSTI